MKISLSHHVGQALAVSLQEALGCQGLILIVIDDNHLKQLGAALPENLAERLPNILRLAADSLESGKGETRCATIDRKED